MPSAFLRAWESRGLALRSKMLASRKGSLGLGGYAELAVQGGSGQ